VATRPPKPQFPAREAALLWVPYSPANAWGMAVSGLFLIALAASALATRRHPVVPVHVTTICVGSLLVIFGTRLALRKTPVIAADERGLLISALGMDRTLLPWEVVGGATVVGTSKNSRWLVILSEDADAAMKHVHPGSRRAVRLHNERWKRPGIAYILAKTLSEPAEVVASRIRELLGETDRTEVLLAGPPSAAPPTEPPRG
jgi:hypothetical protein